ncbi:MAG: DMT family transporter [Chloroflexota bacterium]|nr:DMT family transporter [Chloroflexota bacterium]
MMWTGIGLSFLGIILITQGGSGLSFQLAATWRGDLIVLAGTLCWSLYNVWLRPLAERYPPLWLTALVVGIGTPFLLSIAVPAAVAQDWSEISWGGWGILIYSALFPLVLGHPIWNTFVRRIGAARTAAYSNLVPAISVSISWIFLGERWTLVQIAGAGLVFAGLYLTGCRRVSSVAETRESRCTKSPKVARR